MLDQVTEQGLQAVLAARSDPSVVTDLDAGTLSDQDREGALRAHLMLSDPGEVPEILEITDQGILLEIANGF